MSAPRLKEPGCTHQHADEPHCQPVFQNSYYCAKCDESWTDSWSCAVDTECPSCGTDTSPENWDVVKGSCACSVLGQT